METASASSQTAMAPRWRAQQRDAVLQEREDSELIRFLHSQLTRVTLWRTGRSRTLFAWLFNFQLCPLLSLRKSTRQSFHCLCLSWCVRACHRDLLHRCCTAVASCTSEHLPLSPFRQFHTDRAPSVCCRATQTRFPYALHLIPVCPIPDAFTVP